MLALHVAIFFPLFRLMESLVGRIIGIMFVVYIGTFTVLKPALVYYYDLYLPYSTNNETAVTQLLVGSFIFLLVQLVVLTIFGRRSTPKFMHWCLDLSTARPLGIWIMFVVFMVGTFIGSVLRFDNFGYLWGDESTFDATQRLAGGSYFINYLAEMLIYGMTAAVAYLYTRYRPLVSFLVFIGLLGITYFIAQLAARTVVLVAVIAWLSSIIPVVRQKKFNLLYLGVLGYVLLIFLYVGNLVRLGNAEAIDPTRAIFGAVVAAASDLGPVDNATLLYFEMEKHSSTDFVQLVGALTPMVLIPSAIFPFKIPPDKDSELNRIFFPEGADTTFYHEGSTLTFTIPASGYADLGYIGVLVASTVYAILLSLYIRAYRSDSSSVRYSAAINLLIHIAAFRLSVETTLMTFYSMLLFMGITKIIAMTFSPARSVLTTPPASN